MSAVDDRVLVSFPDGSVRAFRIVEGDAKRLVIEALPERLLADVQRELDCVTISAEEFEARFGAALPPDGEG